MLSVFVEFTDSLLVGQASDWLWLVIVVYGFCLFTWSFFYWVVAFIENVHLVLVAPETVPFRVLLFYETVVWNVCCQEWVFVVLVCAFAYVAETYSEFVLWILTWNVSAVAWNLGSRVWDVHYFCFYY